MALTFRDEEAGPLTSVQQDANIRTLRDMIQEAIDNPSPGVGITNVTQSGSTLTVHLSNGSTRGPFTMPTPNFRFRGEWLPSTAYLIGDFYSRDGVGLFTVVEAHTSPLTFDAGDVRHELAVPFFASPEGWLEIFMSSTENSLTMDLALHDKFIANITDDCEVQVPLNGYAGQPFALRLVIDTGSVGTAVTFSPSYLGAPPSVLTDEGDETVLSGVVLDTDPEATDPGTTAVINTLKEIPA